MKCKTKVIREGKSKACGLDLYALSTHDTPKARDKKTGEVLSYDRKIHWRCPDMHQAETERVVPAALLEPDPQPKAESINRFKHKGFTGHKRNKPRRGIIYPPELTNHRRSIMRQQQRNQLKEVQQNAKASAS